MAFPALPVTWQLGDLQFNVGPDENDVSRVASVNGWDGTAPGTPLLTKRVAGHGAYRGPNYRGAKSVELVGWSQVESPELRQAEINRLNGLCFGPNTLFPLTQTLADGEQHTMYCELAGEIQVVKLADGLSLKFSVPLVAPDPVRISASNPTQYAALPTPAQGGIAWNGSTAVTAGTGIEWNGTAAVTGGLIYQTTSGVLGLITLINSGNVDAPITFGITVASNGLAINPTITRQDTGERLTYAETVQPGSVVTIDTRTGEAFLDGASRGGSLIGSLLTVPAFGSVDLAFTADVGSSNTTLSASNPNVNS